MIPYKDMIAAFERMLNDKWGYIPSTAGELWTQAKQDATKNEMARRYGQKWVGHRVADCSGAFVYAYKLHGMSIYHGSNRIAREYVVELLPPEQAQAGMAAFKSYPQGSSNWKLPSEYRQGGSRCNGDLNDYYHIGLVDTDPRYIINAATTQNGVIRSKISNGWTAVGFLKAVAYEEARPLPDVMYVTAEGGKNVNMRESTSTSSRIIAKVPIGAEVKVIGVASNGWTNVQWNDRKGWMMSKFLTDKQPQAQEQPNVEEQENHQPDFNAVRMAINLVKTQADDIIRAADTALQRLAEIEAKEG